MRSKCNIAVSLWVERAGDPASRTMSAGVIGINALLLCN
jgi:hypothetical protein